MTAVVKYREYPVDDIYRRSTVHAEHSTVDAALAATGSKMTYGGASASVLSWLLSSQFGMLMGILIGLAGLCINWYYKHKEDKRQQLEHERRMSAPFGRV